MKRYIITIILLLGFRCLYSQIWISTDEDGVAYQNAVFANAVLNAFGEDSVSDWLENQKNVVVALSIDTLGYLQRIHRVSSKYHYFTSDDIKRLEQSWNKIGLRVPLCYEKEYWLSEEKQHELIICHIRTSGRDSLVQILGFNPLLTHPLCLSVDSLKAEIIRRLGKIY